MNRLDRLESRMAYLTRRTITTRAALLGAALTITLITVGIFACPGN